MDKQDVITIADGLKMIEDGVEKIQSVMREKKIKSLREVATELIPMLKDDDHEINESIRTHPAEFRICRCPGRHDFQCLAPVPAR